MKNHIDEQFIQVFEHLETPPPPMVWEGVAAHLDKKKRRVGIFYWTTAALATLALSSYAIVSLGDTKKEAFAKIPMLETSHFTEVKTEKTAATTTTVFSGNEVKINTKIAPQTKRTTVNNSLSQNANANATQALSERENKIETKETIVTNTLINNKLASIAELTILFPQGITLQTKSIKRDNDCYEFTKKKRRKSSHFYIDTYFGFDYVNKTMESNNDARKTLQYRQESESLSNAFSGGIRVGAMRGAMGLSTGVHVNHIVEAFENVNNFSEKTNITINKITDASGKVIRLDTVVEQIRGKETSLLHNRYTTLNIPLQLSFHKTISNWKLGIYAGPVFNLKLNKSGTIFNENKVAQRFDNSSTIFKSRLDVAWMGSICASRRLTNHLYFLIEPTFLYQNASFTQAPYEITQRYRSRANLSLGLRYQF
jgi:hypothetical protein